MSAIRRGTVLIAIAASTVAVFAGVAYAAGSHWTIEPTPVPRAPTGSLASVSCVPISGGERCAAVGTALADDGTTTDLTVFGNGTGWQAVAPPRTSDGPGASLSAVACVRSDLCFAVGNDLSHPLAAEWNGASWTVLPTPDPAPGDDATANLVGIACASATRCSAVGNYHTSTTPTTPLVLTWDGSNWTQADTGVPDGATGADLNGVDCPNTQLCLAVGTQTLQHTPAPLTARIAGTTVTYGSAPTRDHGAALAGVSCTTGTTCTAVGHSEDAQFRDSTLVEVLSGGQWTIVDSPNATGISNDLSAVTCTSADSCLAVGQTTPYNKGLTLAEVWNGTSWQISASPNGAADNYTGFAGVSCVAADDCLAVGSRTEYTEPGQSFTARWHDAHWHVVPGGNRAGLRPSDFAAVSCASQTSCVGVGASATTAKHDQLFAETRDAQGWTVDALPEIAGFSDAALRGVSCPAVGVCMAVGWTSNGRYGGAPSDHSLALRLQAGTWSRGTVANPAGGDQLVAVSCPTTTFCAAVGTAGNVAQAQTYDGSWHASPLPAVNTEGPVVLNAVSCATPTRCVAVGSYLDTTTFDAVPIAYEWNGTTWSDVSTGLTGDPSAVSCTSATFCMAVGLRFSADHEYPLTESWDGTQWTAVAVAGGFKGVLESVSCVSAQNCVAAGQRFTAAAELIEQWTGSQWLLRKDVEQDGSSAANLDGVSCGSATDCVAAGDRGNSAQAPLVVSTSG